MGQWQSLRAVSRVVTTSSDDNAYYRPQGPIENGLRSMVDAWNAEAFLWTIEAARQDWNDWCVPAVRNHLALTTVMRWDQCNNAATEIAAGHGAVGELRDTT
eukprot:1690896-Pyramimonas_sp.AAC.1